MPVRYTCVCVCVYILHIGNIWIYYHVRRETKKVALHCYTRVKMKAYTQAHIALESPVFPVTFRHLRMYNWKPFLKPPSCGLRWHQPGDWRKSRTAATGHQFISETLSPRKGHSPYDFLQPLHQWFTKCAPRILRDPCIHLCNGYFEVWFFVKNNRGTSLSGDTFISYER